MVFDIDPTLNFGDTFWVPRVYRNTVGKNKNTYIKIEE